MSHGTCYISVVHCHLSHVTCHRSCVKCHFFLSFLDRCEAYWWRICYRQGLPLLVFMRKGLGTHIYTVQWSFICIYIFIIIKIQCESFQIINSKKKKLYFSLNIRPSTMRYLTQKVYLHLFCIFKSSLSVTNSNKPVNVTLEVSCKV